MQAFLNNPIGIVPSLYNNDLRLTYFIALAAKYRITLPTAPFIIQGEYYEKNL